jgi:ornithine cyclodeaminase
MNLVDVPLMKRLLLEVGVERFLSGLTDQIESDFQRWPQFEKCARLATHAPRGVVELMPASDGTTYGFKFVNGHPANTADGKLTVTAFGALADLATGYPLFLCEMTFLTALRTAATSALAARYLARADADCMALLGTGAQGEFQALAFKAVNGVKRVRYYDPDARAMEKFARNLARTDLQLQPVRSVAEAMEGADIVTTATATKARVAVVADEWIRPGMHFNAIGGDCPGKTELTERMLREARVVVEYSPQTRIEGEIQSLGTDFKVTELWEIIAGHAPGRRTAQEITVFDSVGFAIEDFSALRFVSGLLERLGIDARVPLIPQPSDPKDLYGLLLEA